MAQRRLNYLFDGRREPFRRFCVSWNSRHSFKFRRSVARTIMPRRPLGHDLDTIVPVQLVDTVGNLLPREGGSSNARARPRRPFAALVSLRPFPSAIAAEKPSSATISPKPRSGSKRRSRPTPARSASRSAQLRREADAAFQKNDFRGGMVLLGQLVATAPDDGANWLRLARAILQIRAADDRERTRPARARRDRGLYRLSAHQQPQRGGRQRSSSSAAASPTARSGGRRSMRCASRSNCARSPTCARNMSGCARITASACSTIRSMPTPPRRAPASSSPRTLPGKRTDFSPVRRGRGPGQARRSRRRQAALRRRPQARRALRHHAARRPAVDRARRRSRKSADFTVYVRDRKPFVRFTGKAYVLPRTGQRGIPVVSVNTKAVAVEVYRIGDRNLINTVLGSDFQRNLDRYDVERLAREPRHQGLERRARGRADAQRRRHDRVPGRSGGRRTAARRLCDGGRAEPAPERRLRVRSRPNGSSSPISG